MQSKILAIIRPKKWRRKKNQSSGTYNSLSSGCKDSGAPEHPGGAERGAAAPPHQEEAVQAPGQDAPPARKEAPGASFINAARVLK